MPLALHDRNAGPLQEVRALWVTRWDYSTPDDVRNIIMHASAAHFNTIYFQVRGNADAFYASHIEPWAQRLTGTLGQDPGWDPLGIAVQQAHLNGLELHAYINVYPAWVGTTAPSVADPEPMYHEFNRLYGSDWVQWHEDGTSMGLNSGYLWASPGHWAVTERVLAVAQDIIVHYNVDGVHLDNVRYAGPAYSHDPVSEDNFALEQVIDPSLTWNEWQRSQISYVVATMHDNLGTLRPNLSLSAAVWPVYRNRWNWWNGPDGFDGYFQDSLAWLRTGSIDAICPMLYGGALQDYEDRFVAALQDLIELAAGRPVYAGISAEYGDFASIARRIELARTMGAQGQAIFSSRLIEQHDFWDEFLQGPYSQPSHLPASDAATRSL